MMFIEISNSSFGTNERLLVIEHSERLLVIEHSERLQILEGNGHYLIFFNFELKSDFFSMSKNYHNSTIFTFVYNFTMAFRKHTNA